MIPHAFYTLIAAGLIFDTRATLIFLLAIVGPVAAIATARRLALGIRSAATRLRTGCTSLARKLAAGRADRSTNRVAIPFPPYDWGRDSVSPFLNWKENPSWD